MGHGMVSRIDHKTLSKNQVTFRFGGAVKQDDCGHGATVYVSFIEGWGYKKKPSGLRPDGLMDVFNNYRLTIKNLDKCTESLPEGEGPYAFRLNR